MISIIFREASENLFDSLLKLGEDTGVSLTPWLSHECSFHIDDGLLFFWRFPFSV